MPTPVTFRNDIESLRGIAVILVVAFHLDLPLVRGGFIGVDVFYVVSGFLIATILDREASITPAALAGFFNRRIKRLVPAYLAMLWWRRSQRGRSCCQTTS